jgi:PAS domain S-box-containing protein
MRFKYSLAYPIIIIISLVAAATLCIGYYLNLYSLQDSIQAREMDRAKSIHHFVEEKISHELQEIVAYSQLFKKDPQLWDGLIAHRVHDDKKPLQQAMDRLSPPLQAMGVNFVLLIDPHNNLLYRTSAYSGEDNTSWIWGLEEALAGTDSLTFGLGPQGWTIMTLVPLIRENKQYGVVILGIYINDYFVRNIAEATLTQISFGNAYQIIASSWPATERRQVDLARITESIVKKQSIFVNNEQLNSSSLYIPLEIVDETICLIINTDTTPITQLLQQKQRQLVSSLLVVLLLTIGLGSGLTWAIVKPLKKLQDRSVEAIKEFSAQDFSLPAWGNELETLSQAVELMLSTIRLHIHQLHLAEAAMRQNESRMRSLYKSIQAGVILQGTDGRILHANQTASDLFAINLNEINGSSSQDPIWQMFWEDGTPVPREEHPAMLTLHTGQPVRNAIRGIFPPGRDKMRWLLINTEPLLDPEAKEVREVTMTFLDITEYKQVEEALKEGKINLQASLKEKEVLLNEVHHRVKNNLQIVISFLNFSRKQTQNQETIDVLNEAQARIHNMAMIHMQLYQTMDFARIDMKSHTQLMVDYLGRIFSHSALIEKQVQGQDISLALNQAIPCSMALVELMTNVFKHAFSPGEKGSLTITLQKVNEKGVRISVKDNGKGIPPDFNVKKLSTLGLELTWGLVEKQLRGQVSIVPGKGTEIVMEFEKTD